MRVRKLVAIAEEYRLGEANALAKLKQAAGVQPSRLSALDESTKAVLLEDVVVCRRGAGAPSRRWRTRPLSEAGWAESTEGASGGSPGSWS